MIRNLAFRHSDIYLGLYINNSNWFGIPTHLKVFLWSRENILLWTSWKVEWNVCLWLTGSFSQSIANIIKYYLYLTYFVTFYPLGSVLLDRTLTCMRTLYSTYTVDWTLTFMRLYYFTYTVERTLTFMRTLFSTSTLEIISIRPVQWL